MTYIIRYAVVPANQIINLCGPECDPFGWTEELIEKRKEKTQKRLNRSNTKVFFQKLEKSVLDQGFRNPILVTAGLFTRAYLKIDREINIFQYVKRIPPEKIHKLEKLLTCERLGGSRLYIAQKNNLDIPCIINDFNEVLPNAEQLNTREDVLQKFTDKPTALIIEKKGVIVGGLPHVHME